MQERTRIGAIEFLILAVSTWGCGSAPQPDLVPATAPLGVAGHSKEVERHESEAAAHEQEYRMQPRTEYSTTYHCVDAPLDGVPSSGGEPLRVMRPCWASVANPSAWHLEEAARQRQFAQEHREKITQLLATEKKVCANLSDSDIRHSPLFQHEDIVAVDLVQHKGEVVGAKVVFRQVKGLSESWLRRAFSCHQARAKVTGFAPEFQAYCPSSLPDVAISTGRSELGFYAVFRSQRPSIVKEIVARATAIRPGE